MELLAPQHLFRILQSFEDKIETEDVTRNGSQNIAMQFFSIKHEDFEEIKSFYKVGSKVFGVEGSEPIGGFSKFVKFQIVLRIFFLMRISNSKF